MASPQASKVAEQIKVIAASMLERRIQDPQLGFVTITDSRLSRDWRRCDLFYTVLGDAEAWAATAAALGRAKGQIRTQVSRQLKLRFAPEIVFTPDAMPEQSAHIEALLAAARNQDARVADLAVGADYAGDPDPYKPDNLDDDTDFGPAADEAAPAAGRETSFEAAAAASPVADGAGPDVATGLDAAGGSNTAAELDTTAELSVVAGLDLAAGLDTAAGLAAAAGLDANAADEAARDA
jgi:ribosome-binding factor A